MWIVFFFGQIWILFYLHGNWTGYNLFSTPTCVIMALCNKYPGIFKQLGLLNKLWHNKKKMCLHSKKNHSHHLEYRWCQAATHIHCWLLPYIISWQQSVPASALPSPCFSVLTVNALPFCLQYCCISMPCCTVVLSAHLHSLAPSRSYPSIPSMSGSQNYSFRMLIV